MDTMDTNRPPSVVAQNTNDYYLRSEEASRSFASTISSSMGRSTSQKRSRSACCACAGPAPRPQEVEIAEQAAAMLLQHDEDAGTFFGDRTLNPSVQEESDRKTVAQAIKNTARLPPTFPLPEDVMSDARRERRNLMSVTHSCCDTSAMSTKHRHRNRSSPASRTRAAHVDPVTPPGGSPVETNSPTSAEPTAASLTAEARARVEQERADAEQRNAERRREIEQLYADHASMSQQNISVRQGISGSLTPIPQDHFGPPMTMTAASHEHLAQDHFRPSMTMPVAPQDHFGPPMTTPSLMASVLNMSQSGVQRYQTSPIEQQGGVVEHSMVYAQDDQMRRAQEEQFRRIQEEQMRQEQMRQEQIRQAQEEQMQMRRAEEEEMRRTAEEQMRQEQTRLEQMRLAEEEQMRQEEQRRTQERLDVERRNEERRLEVERRVEMERRMEEERFERERRMQEERREQILREVEERNRVVEQQRLEVERRNAESRAQIEREVEQRNAMTRQGPSTSPTVGEVWRIHQEAALEKRFEQERLERERLRVQDELRAMEQRNEEARRRVEESMRRTNEEYQQRMAEGAAQVSVAQLEQERVERERWLEQQRMEIEQRNAENRRKAEMTIQEIHSRYNTSIQEIRSRESQVPRQVSVRTGRPLSQPPPESRQTTMMRRDHSCIPVMGDSRLIGEYEIGERVETSRRVVDVRESGGVDRAALIERFGAENVGHDELGDYLIRKVEVFKLEVQKKEIRVPEVREVVREMKVPHYETKEIMVEKPEIRWVDRQVEVVQEVEQEVKRPVKVVVDQEIPRVKERKVPQIVNKEVVKNVPGEIVEVPITYVVNRPVIRPKYIDRKVPVVIAQSFHPMVYESIDEKNAVEIDCRVYKFKPVHQDVFIPLPAERPLLFQQLRVEHREVLASHVADEQYNALVKALNPSLNFQDAEDLLKFIPQDRRDSYNGLWYNTEVGPFGAITGLGSEGAQALENLQVRSTLQADYRPLLHQRTRAPAIPHPILPESMVTFQKVGAIHETIKQTASANASSYSSKHTTRGFAEQVHNLAQQFAMPPPTQSLAVDRQTIDTAGETIREDQMAPSGPPREYHTEAHHCRAMLSIGDSSASSYQAQSSKGPSLMELRPQEKVKTAPVKPTHINKSVPTHIKSREEDDNTEHDVNSEEGIMTISGLSIDNSHPNGSSRNGALSSLLEWVQSCVGENAEILEVAQKKRSRRGRRH